MFIQRPYARFVFSVSRRLVEYTIYIYIHILIDERKSYSVVLC